MPNEIKVSSIRPAEYNPREMTKEQHVILGRSLVKFGDLSGIVVNVKTGNLVGGHQRLRHLNAEWPILKEPFKDKAGTVARGDIVTPWGPMSYREVSWDLKTEMAANVAANKISGDWNFKSLKELLSELNDGEFDLTLTGFTEEELGKLIDYESSGPVENEGNVPSLPKVPKTKPGDLYVLGKHRVLCGDATSVANVARVVGPNKANMMWTDPPYGVDIESVNKSLAKVGKASTTRKNHGFENDLSAGLPGILSGAFGAADAEALEDGAVIYIAHPAGALSFVFGDAVRALEWRLHETLVWVKDVMVLGHSDYHYRHEPIFLCYKAGGGRRGRGGAGWYGPNNATSVLEYPKPARSDEHPTMKPVALVEECIKNSSGNGGVVFDPFLGSGTTLIAAEQAGRVCVGLELSPAYVDVIVQRWEKLTGKTAKLDKK